MLRSLFTSQNWLQRYHRLIDAMQPINIFIGPDMHAKNALYTLQNLKLVLQKHMFFYCHNHVSPLQVKGFS